MSQLPYAAVMVLIIVWAVTVCYFLLLWFATTLQMAVAGSILFVLFALKITVKALPLLLANRPAMEPPQPEPGVANLNQPPQGRRQPPSTSQRPR